jgi:long-chain acyl-CoA synthetase
VQIPIKPDDNLFDLFLGRVKETPDAVGYTQYRDGVWVDYTWSEVAALVSRWRNAMARDGMQAGDRVSIATRNRLEWVLFDQAALSLGLVTVPLYFNDRPDNMAWCMNDAESRLLILEDDSLWLEISQGAPTVERVVTLAPPSTADKRVVFVEDWLRDDAVRLGRSPARGGEMATIIYTSGTTGRPKGVMLSHRNILANIESANASVTTIEASDRLVSFLPLSHSFERTAGNYLCIRGGGHTVYARGITELAEDIAHHKPTILICVPRIFERIYARMQEGLPPGSFKRTLFEKAVDVGWKRFKGEASAADKLLWPVLNLLVARKLQRRLGGRLRLVVVGAAALAAEHARVFVGLGLPIIHGYGLTETAPVISGNRLDDNDPASVGAPLQGVEVRIADDGEILARGENIMMGYWHHPEATAATIDKDGWLHTGDIGEIRNGKIYITGRAKEIFVMSNGEKLPPGDVEQAILMDPAFEQVLLVGEGRNRLGLLAVSKIEDTRQLRERANRQLAGFPGWVRIDRVLRFAEPWSIENGMMTPTLKLKRNKIEQQYAAEIDALFGQVG